MWVGSFWTRVKCKEIRKEEYVKQNEIANKTTNGVVTNSGNKGNELVRG